MNWIAGLIATRGWMRAHAARWFPEREFFMRSEGHVRFVRISTRFQTRIAAALAVLVLTWGGVLAWALIGQVFAGTDRHALLQREAAVANAESRVTRYHANLDAVATDLKRRQDFLEKAVQSVIGPMPATLPKGTVSDSTGETARTVRKISQAMPQAAGLARIEARQIAFAERLTRFADDRANAASGAIRKVGLNPDSVIAGDAHAQGGPLIRLGWNGIDPRFERLAASLGQMSAMNAGLAHIPNAMPASFEYISSGFGVRTDPIVGGAAFHPGLDFKGPVGAPIYAAATGEVSFTGVRQGYGNCVEISHGHGLVTRYAHMSRIIAHLGQTVVAGTPIGAIGSTGRSTGPHLHFEVRVNDRPVNPRPFLEAPLPHVFQETQSAGRPVSHG
ncbi:peptidoglycan DD-metalloendopeptidase family protein [Novosphingobium sp.]|uniref:peptidoglycan DD-metalloendopeptidase family protein n=1 Tax=Novosphingobium sp. TaxID=1874826 RepID=UPI003D0CFFF8